MKHDKDDFGITLVEVLVYIVVSGLVLAGLALMFANGLGEQTKAAQRDRATGPANIISTSLSELRNATMVTNVSTVAGHGIVAAVIDESGDLYCRAWVVGVAQPTAEASTATDGDLLYRAPDSPREPIDINSGVSGWGALFRHNDHSGRIDAVSGTLDSLSASRGVVVNLEVAVGTEERREVVEINNIVIPQAVVPGTEGFSCIQN